MVGGYMLCICSSGPEALDNAEAFSPDLILLDVMMPILDGPATLTGLRLIPSLADTPAVFVTANAQQNEITRLISLGAIGVIPKPFDPMTLAAQVQQLWDST